jgi:2-methylcitrate dehydratase
VLANKEIDSLFPAVKRAIATITTQDGRELRETVDHAKGSPENPMSDKEIVAKFRANASGIVSQARQEEIIEATWNLEDFTDMGDYMRLLVKDR